MLRNDTYRFFKYSHKNILIESLKPYNFKTNSEKNIFLHQLPVSPTMSVANQLHDIIDMCKKYNGYSLTIGFTDKDPIICSYDVGCSDLVIWNHGNMHYWDILNLSRRQHISNPNKLFLSSKAVNIIANIDKDYPLNLCNKFNKCWLNFMFSMMLVENNLSYGLVL